ncbi:hypothetical protein [Geobacter sp.]|uniref:hypothetical protein n=1 Tax=Geobacter sp. TaxID=46610 RepID=UPI00262AB7D6|nr:hypothetical protein [Geobacter sp.]
MRMILLVGMVLLPRMLFAATDCRVAEFPDHYEVICTGDEKAGAVQAQTPAQTKASDQTPTAANQKQPAAPKKTPAQAQAAAAIAREEAAKALLAYREHLATMKSVRDAARASRMKLIREERERQRLENKDKDGPNLKKPDDPMTDMGTAGDEP